MKTKTIVATLLIAAAASADARFAWPYPRKAVSPDESGHWIVINGNAWPDTTEPELTTFADGQTRHGEASPSGGGPDGLKSIANQEGKGRAQDWSVSFCVAGISTLFTGFQRPSSLANQRSTVGNFQAIRVSKR
jgi:hypothetical protein